MSIIVRPIDNDAEAAQHGFISAYAFDGDRSEAAMALRSEYYPRDWLLGAFDGQELVAGLAIIPFEQFFEGVRIALGGIASVSCLPERRRQGFVGALLREALVRMHEAGQPLSALHTPHPALYRRFGWETAGRAALYAFAPKRARPRVRPNGGAWRRVDAASWAELNSVYETHYAPRNGALSRDERRWRNHVFSDYGKGTHDAAVWFGDGGRARAYVVYRTQRKPVAGSFLAETTLRVIDWCALDAEAYAAVIGYLAGHDLADKVIMFAPAEEPLGLALDDPSCIETPTALWHGPMLRIVDVPHAIEARAAGVGGHGIEVVIEVGDETAPWNAGRWRIAAHAGRLSCVRSSQPAAAAMDVRGLAAIYNGATCPEDAVRAGLIEADRRALDALTALFATTYAPFCADDF
jgi:predicted acetyltransferase